MDEQTGIEYPKIQIGGIEYAVKFTVETMYDLGKAGVAFSPRYDGPTSTWHCEFTNLCDVLKVVVGFPGTARELAPLIFETRDDITAALIEGWGKVVLPTLKRRAEAAKARAAAKLMAEAPATQQPV